MRVLILGGGTIGSSIARMLCPKNSVTLVDINPEIARELDSELDIRAVCGSASQSSVLFQAGAPTADICLALTGIDEINIVGASIARAMGTSRVAARVYSQIFRDLSTFDYRHHFGIDRLLSIENLTAMELACKIREPGAMLIEHFANGEIEMQNVVITKPSPLLGVELGKLKMSPDLRIGTICRNTNTNIASATDTIEIGDTITLFGIRSSVESMKRTLNVPSLQRQSVVIAGGGECGYHLAQILEVRNYKITIFDADRSRCDYLAGQLKKSMVCFGDASQKKVLEELNIGKSDIFVACMGDDENNIMSCVEARELGAEQLFAVINRPDYAAVIGKFGISAAISPQSVLRRQVEGFMHQGPLVYNNSNLLSGEIDVAELEAGKNSLISQQELKDCGLPKQALFAAIISGNTVYVPDAHSIIKPGDTVVSVVHSSCISAMEKLFAPRPD
ncbi:MAG: Trk system potassium transporter TrkA [Planctomycetia bacterium]|nr:Trk system potassium transporter TrkA [Planctomycetia bacterium]